MEYGRKILAAIEAGAGEAYEEIEARASLPLRDSFDSDESYDEAVDRAELEVLQELIKEELASG